MTITISKTSDWARIPENSNNLKLLIRARLTSDWTHHIKQCKSLKIILPERSALGNIKGLFQIEGCTAIYLHRSDRERLGHFTLPDTLDLGDRHIRLVIDTCLSKSKLDTLYNLCSTNRFLTVGHKIGPRYHEEITRLLPWTDGLYIMQPNIPDITGYRINVLNISPHYLDPRYYPTKLKALIIKTDTMTVNEYRSLVRYIVAFGTDLILKVRTPIAGLEINDVLHLLNSSWTMLELFLENIFTEEEEQLLHPVLYKKTGWLETNLIRTPLIHNIRLRHCKFDCDPIVKDQLKVICARNRDNQCKLLPLNRLAYKACKAYGITIPSYLE